MTLVVSTDTKPAKRKVKTKLSARRAKAGAISAAENNSPLRWGAEAIAPEIGLEPKAFYHLYYSGAFDGCVTKVQGRLCGNIPKLIAKLSGD